MSVYVESDKGNIIVSGDALSDGGSITRGLPQNVFYDKFQATDSIQKMVNTSKIFILVMIVRLKLDRVLLNTLKARRK